MLKMKQVVLTLAVTLFCVTQASQARSYCSDTSSMGRKIQQEADKHVGSSTWSFYAIRKYCKTKCNKCNMFVAEMIEDAGGSVPHRYPFVWTPIGTNEWANPKSRYLRRAWCWKLVVGCYKDGDVAATSGNPMGHVGIVTGENTVTSANRYVIVKNNWGFRSGQNPTFWRYTC